MKPPPIRDQSESSQISQSQGFFSKLLGVLALLLSLLSIESTTEFTGTCKCLQTAAKLSVDWNVRDPSSASKARVIFFRNPKTGMIISLPHPKKDLGQGLVSKIYRDANWPKD
jgi:hypothetical protein